jgi:transposase-like protein
MKKNNFTNECPSCKGELESEGIFRRFSRRNFRFERFRCKECGQPLEKEIDDPIEKIFPIIRDVSIEVLEQGERSPRRYSKGSISGILFICTNPKCTNPRIYIEPILREMIDTRQSHKETWEFCNGFEPSPKWRRKNPCDRSFKITIDLVFAETENSEN